MTEVLTTKAVEGDEDYVDKVSPVPDGRPNIHAKHLSIIVSTGTEDRDRSLEDFYTLVEAAIMTIAKAKRVTLVSSYYILDGKVCKPDDYDAAKQGFKPGHYSPPWAGGPNPVYTAPQRDLPGRSPAEPHKTKPLTTKVDAALNQALAAVQSAATTQETTS